jgi:serine-type D-Ala-D-Ala carboxypeptidase/endopeptidase
MRRSVLQLAAGLLSACVTLVRPAPAQHFPQERDLTALLQDRVADRRAVGIAVGVLEADGSTRVAFAGDPGRGARPFSGRSGFEIGSITKTFTGILLAEMVRTGEVRYDDPVSRYLPDGVRVPSRNGREITLLDLATHHSGLPGMPDNMEYADHSNPYADYTVAQMYAFLSGFQLQADPGTAYGYSNLGSGLLGHALSRATNTPYEELVRERILRPLGMEGTTIELRGELAEQMVEGHNKRGFVVPYWDLPTIAGAGAFRSNLDDMLRFLAANLGPPATDLEQSMRAAQGPQRTVSDSTFVRLGYDAIGMGWQIRSVGNARIVWKDGGTAGFQTFVGFDPERGVAVAVLSNTAIEVDDIGFHLLNPELPLGEPAPIPLLGLDVPESALQQYVGEYYLEPQYSVVVRLEGGVLSIQGTGEERLGWLHLSAESETRFYLKDFDAQVVFVRDPSGAVTGLVYHASGTETPGRKVR